MVATLVIIAVILIAAGLICMALRRKVSAERNAKLIAHIDAQRKMISRADRTAMQVMGIAETAVNGVDAKVDIANRKLDMLIRHVGVEEALPHRGRHRPHIVSADDDDERYIS